VSSCACFLYGVCILRNGSVDHVYIPQMLYASCVKIVFMLGTCSGYCMLCLCGVYVYCSYVVPMWRVCC